MGGQINEELLLKSADNNHLKYDRTMLRGFKLRAIATFKCVTNIYAINPPGRLDVRSMINDSYTHRLPTQDWKFVS